MTETYCRCGHGLSVHHWVNGKAQPCTQCDCPDVRAMKLRAAQRSEQPAESTPEETK